MKAATFEKIELNQIIDTAIMDGVSQLVTSYDNDQYGISKEAAIEAFYKTLYINFNVLGDEVAQKRIQGYIPITLVIDYDGYYALVNRAYTNDAGYKEMELIWSEKKTFSYYDGDYIYLFTLTDELTVIDATTMQSYTGGQEDLKTIIPTNIIQDDGYFNEVKQNTIINLLEEELQLAINNHNDMASLYGITYHFHLPKIDTSDWANTISDIGMITFIQGIPLSSTNEYYNNFALGGAGVVKQPVYYIQEDPATNILYYHRADCSSLTDDSTVYSSREKCAAAGAYPCPLCKP
jgi:hypothetical protein